MYRYSLHLFSVENRTDYKVSLYRRKARVEADGD